MAPFSVFNLRKFQAMTVRNLHVGLSLRSPRHIGK